MTARIPLLTLVLLASLAHRVPAAQAGACRVEPAQYAALRNGMSYRRVRHTLGCSGRKVGRIVVGRDRRTTYSWPAKGTYGANVTLTFHDGRLTDKSQLGLR